MRVRLKYSITGKVRFISHLDLMRAFFRACIRGQIPVVISKGYSPHLKLSFGPPLSVGMSSSCEYADIYLEKEFPFDRLKDSIQEGLPEGINIQRVYTVMDSLPSLTATAKGVRYSIEVPQEYFGDIEDRIAIFLQKRNILVKRENGSFKDIRPAVAELKVDDNKALIVYIALDKNTSARPIDVINVLWPEAKADELKLWRITRKEIIGV